MLDGSGEDGGSIFQLGKGGWQATNHDKVALGCLPCSRDPNVGMMWHIEQCLVASSHKEGRGQTGCQCLEVAGSSGVGERNDDTQPCS